MQILKVSSKNLKDTVKQAAKIIKQGGVLICPTDTVYGLIADAKNEVAVNKVFKIKKRAETKPLPVFVKDLKTAKKIARINKKQEIVLKKFWPGKLTAVLKIKYKKFPKGILSKDKKIGLRIPNYKLLNLILEKSNCALTATSANISGLGSLTDIKKILKQFKNKKNQPDLVLDAKSLKKSLSSTVVDLTLIPKGLTGSGATGLISIPKGLTGSGATGLIKFKILREGQIPKKKILKITGV